MKWKMLLIFVSILIWTNISNAEEFPVMGYYDPYSLDTIQMDIDSAYSQMKEFGLTHICAWGTANTIKKASEYGIELMLDNDFYTHIIKSLIDIEYDLSSNMFPFNDVDTSIHLEHFAQTGIYHVLDIEQEYEYDGYFFEPDENVGMEDDDGFFECLVNFHIEGFLFDGLGWDGTYYGFNGSAFAHWTGDNYDSATAEFYLRIPDNSGDSTSVCIIAVANGRNDKQLATREIYNVDFTQTDTFEVFKIRFPQNDTIISGGDTIIKPIFFMPQLYWLDSVDLHVDKVRAYNYTGETIVIETSESEIISNMDDYFDGLGNYSNCVHTYYLPGSGALPLIIVPPLKLVIRPPLSSFGLV
jgi:hypothetical protein